MPGWRSGNVVTTAALLGAFCLGFFPARAHGREAGEKPTVEMRAFVNWDYRKRQKLRGWMTSAAVIEKSLAAWYPGCRFQLVTNGSPARLKQFMAALPGGDECDLSVLYLAGHQSRDTWWHFPDEDATGWEAMLREVPEHPRRLVVLDSCFASGVEKLASWKSKLRGQWLFSSGPSEETFELNVRRRQPVNLRRRYPETVRWLEDNLPADWDGRISFLGFVWTSAFLKTPNPPRGTAGWAAFLRRCAAVADELDALGARRFSSEISYVYSP